MIGQCLVLSWSLLWVRKGSSDGGGGGGGGREEEIHKVGYWVLLIVRLLPF